ncbi:unnamed protein product [Effrenium voratum]|nr:unnamed protein product [Effrenium voratum]
MGDEEEKKPDCVKVAVRLRPLSSKELGNNESSIIELTEQTSGTGTATGSVVINDPDNKEKPSTFAFDIVFGTGTMQETVFQAVGQAAVNSTLTGYNGTIFAYGQTGSGKSWCMMGGGGDLKGIIPRVNEQLFVRIDELQQAVSSRKFLVMCSFFEIYNEIIFDLLNPVQDRSKLGAGLQVKEHPVLGIYVKDLQEIVVSDADKLVQLMNSGTKNRAVSSTMMNSVSSRSHSIFTIKVHQKDDEDKSKNVFAKLNLVDLAGSERQKGTGASGQTLKEGANINKSLSALGNVINALVEIANGKKVFVPFRNSKLTRVLQESLGGNSLCTMLATLSPAACNYEETMSTLRYANRAKAIKVSATKNEEASQISRLNSEIEELKKKLAAADQGAGGGMGSMSDEEKRAMQEKFSAQLSDMQKMVSSTWEDKAKLSADYESQINKALDEQKKQARAMQEECRKRLRLLEDQNDLELSIRGLIGTLQSLPGGSLPCEKLRSCEMPGQWLKIVADIAEVAEDAKKDSTMAVAFQSAFREDLRLWVDGEEAADYSMARTGARRALTKLETLKREMSKLGALEVAGRTKAQDFAQAVRGAHEEWLQGLEAVKEELRGESEMGDASPTVDQSGISPLHAQMLEDIGRILQLIESQARAKADAEFDDLSGEAPALAELVLRGLELVGGDKLPEEEVIRSVLGADDGPRPPRDSRPMHEWGPDDVDDTPEGTEFVLAQVVSLESLNKKRTALELLSRPPPKFVHDVALLIQQQTGFLQAMSQEWPEQSRDARIELLQYIADSASAAVGVKRIDFDPADVLKGKEVTKTLRLLQLLAVAAAKFLNRGRLQRKPSKTRLSAMTPFLDAVSRCLRAVMDSARENGASPKEDGDASFRALQDRLEAEQQLRKKNEERLLEVHKESESFRQALAERNQQLDQATQAAVATSQKKARLQKDVTTFRQNLLAKALSMGNPKVESLKTEIENHSRLADSHQEEKASLQKNLQEMVQEQIEADTQRETLEMEVQRMQVTVASSEELLGVQTEHQKLSMKIASLQEKMRQISEEEDAEREQEAQLLEDKKQMLAKSEDLQMQLQVIIEERDGLREGMDLDWQEKTRLEEELENVSEGYVHLSERLNEKEEEGQELQEQLQQCDNLLEMLQAKAGRDQLAAPAPPPKPPDDPPDAASSHYSDEDFEEPDED